MGTDLNETLKIPLSNSMIFQMKNEYLGWERAFLWKYIFFYGSKQPFPPERRVEDGLGDKDFMTETALSSKSGF